MKRKKRKRPTIIRKFVVTYRGTKSHLIVSSEKVTIVEIGSSKKKKTNRPVILRIIRTKRISGVHPLSAIFRRRESDQTFGVIICCVLLESKEFKSYRIFSSNKKDEFALICLLQSVSFHLPTHHCPPLRRRVRRILILINPTSGGGKSLELFKQHARPILDFAHLQYDTIITQRVQHAVEIARNLDILKYNEIGCVGGDGLLNEIVRGLMEHPKLHHKEIKRIPISVFPTGTGNAFSWELGIHPIWIGTAALACARGKYCYADVCSLFFSGRREVSVLSFSHGLYPDIDFGYKNFKFLGEGRYFVGILHSFIAHKCVDVELEVVRSRDQDSSAIKPENDEERNRALQFKSCFVRNPDFEKMYESGISVSKSSRQQLEIEEEEEERVKSAGPRTRIIMGDGPRERDRASQMNHQARPLPVIGKACRNVMKDCSLLRKHFKNTFSRVASGYVLKMEEDRELDDIYTFNRKMKEEELDDDDEDEDEDSNDDDDNSFDIKEEEESEGENSEMESSDDRTKSKHHKSLLTKGSEEEDENNGNTYVENLSGSYFLFAICNTRRVSYDIPLAINQRLNNGFLDLVVMQKSKGRWGAFKELLNIVFRSPSSSSSSKKKMNKEVMKKKEEEEEDLEQQQRREEEENRYYRSIELRRFKAFRFKPLGGHSCLDIDGERRDNAEVLGELHNNFISVIHM